MQHNINECTTIKTQLRPENQAALFPVTIEQSVDWDKRLSAIFLSFFKKA